MNSKNFFETWKSFVRKEIINFSFWQKVAFINLCCERVLPNYLFYAKAQKFGNPEFLRILLNKSWFCLEKKSIPFSEEVYKCLKKLETSHIVPDSSESMFANWAQDSIISVYDLLRYYQNKEDDLIIKISLVSIETVLKYIYEKFGYIDDFHPDYEEILLSYEIMENEISKQKDYLNTISNIKILNEFQVKALRKNFVQEDSNIGLK